MGGGGPTGDPTGPHSADKKQTAPTKPKPSKPTK